jgi:Peptidase M60, enhancin and enhancin-like/N-terminal domain of M60-like peptidases
LRFVSKLLSTTAQISSHRQFQINTMQLNRHFFLASVLFAVLCCTNMACTKTDDTAADTTMISRTVFEIQSLPSGEAEAERLGQEQRASDFTPTALYLPPNQTVTLEVTHTAGSDLPTLLVGTYSRYATHENPQTVNLTMGKNSITANQYGGLMYLRYTKTTSEVSKAKVEFLSGYKIAPLFVLDKTTTTDWAAQLQKYTETPDVLMLGTREFMVFSRAKALTWQNNDQNAVLRTADEIWNLEDKISGLDGSAPAHQPNLHKVLMTETDLPDTYMFATYYRTAYFDDVAKHAFTPLNRTDGWGPWHELGHMHQQGAWTWEAVGEVTVNVYSLAVHRAFGIADSRLQAENAWNKMDTFFDISTATRDYNDTLQTDFFTRLCLFEQLRMAFGDAFYKELHKRTRINAPVLNNDAEKMQYFMVESSKIAGKDLTNFFRKWGFVGVEDGFTQISNLGLPQPTVEPSTLRE